MDERHAAALWAALILAAVILRALLVVLSPRPDGYSFDFYYQGVEVLNSTGRLPRAEDCWQCYHPPLFYMLGALFYRGAWLLSGTRSGALAGLSVLSLASTALATYYSIQLLRQLTPRRSSSRISIFSRSQLVRCSGSECAWLSALSLVDSAVE